MEQGPAHCPGTIQGMLWDRASRSWRLPGRTMWPLHGLPGCLAAWQFPCASRIHQGMRAHLIPMSSTSSLRAPLDSLHTSSPLLIACRNDQNQCSK